MKKLPALFSIALLMSAVFASSANAQMGGMGGSTSNRIVSFGLGGGVSVPLSDAKDAFKNGFVGHGFARLNLRTLPIAPRIDFTFSQFDLASAKVASPGVSGTGQVFAGLANLQYFLMPGGPIRPYIVAGVGAYNVKTDVTGIAGASSNDTRFGVNGGGGVLLKLGSVISAYLEGRVDNVYSQKGFVNSDQIQVVPVTLGVIF